MLHHFIANHRSELIALCRTRAETRRAPRATSAEVEHGVPVFIDQVTVMMREEGGDPPAPREAGASVPPTEFDAEARRHGASLLRRGFGIDQVVHSYGDVCQSITALAMHRRAEISVAEFASLNIKLDNAIAGAVTEFACQREAFVSTGAEVAANERLGMLAHEMRNLLNTTILAVSAIKGGSVGFGGATAAALDRSLIGMRSLIDRTLAQARLEGGGAYVIDRIQLAAFVQEVRVAASLEASNAGCELVVPPVGNDVFVEADRHMLASAVANLLQNAFKFTRLGTPVVLHAHANAEQVFIDVEDRCGGLRASPEELFAPFRQFDPDRSGAGLGLAISRKAVEANGGRLVAKDHPGHGCTFQIQLPRR